MKWKDRSPSYRKGFWLGVGDALLIMIVIPIVGFFFWITIFIN